MLQYFIRLLQYLKTIEPYLNERRVLSDIGVPPKQIEQIMEEYENANLLVQEF